MRQLPISTSRHLLSFMWIAKHSTPPRHGRINDRAEEKKQHEFGKPSLHDTILRLSLRSPAALWTTGGEVTAQVVAAFQTLASIPT